MVEALDVAQLEGQMPFLGSTATPPRLATVPLLIVMLRRGNRHTVEVTEATVITPTLLIPPGSDDAQS